MENDARIEQFKKMAQEDPNNELGHFSLGKAYLSSLSKEELATRIDQLQLTAKTADTIVNRDVLHKELLKAKRQLNTEEAAAIASHVGHGMEILQECGILNQDVIDMVAHHHERFDGSGYPSGMSRDEIPPFARIAASVDTYDAITSNRDYAPAVAPADAIKLLYNARDEDFQAELVEAFIQAIGIYPAGTLVELSSGEVGVIVAEYRTRRLRPKVLLLLDANKNSLRKSKLVDLQEHAADAGNPSLSIKKSLEPESYGIDLSQVSLQQ